MDTNNRQFYPAVCVQEITEDISYDKLDDRQDGIVEECTLDSAKFISVSIYKLGTRNYCAVEKEKTSHSKAVSLCKSFNAKLPLPKNSDESKAFLKAFPFSFWIDLTDPDRTGNTRNWRDSNGAKPFYVQASLFYL